MKPLEHEPWVEHYRLALFEENAARMPERIAAASSAIWTRIGDLQSTPDYRREIQALYDALGILHLLETESHRKKMD
jgi:hypothetical protein